MAKAGWKKAKTLDQIDAGLSTLKSSSSETRRFLGSNMDTESQDMPTRKKNKLDPLTEKLGCTGYFHAMRWEWFKYEYGGIRYALEVSRFYQEKNIAIDIQPKDKEHVELKRILLQKHNIKYLVVDSFDDVMRSLQEVM